MVYFHSITIHYYTLLFFLWSKIRPVQVRILFFFHQWIYFQFKCYNRYIWSCPIRIDTGIHTHTYTTRAPINCSFIWLFERRSIRSLHFISLNIFFFIRYCCSVRIPLFCIRLSLYNLGGNGNPVINNIVYNFYLLLFSRLPQSQSHWVCVCVFVCLLLRYVCNFIRSIWINFMVVSIQAMVNVEMKTKDQGGKKRQTERRGRTKGSNRTRNKKNYRVNFVVVCKFQHIISDKTPNWINSHDRIRLTRSNSMRREIQQPNEKWEMLSNGGKKEQITSIYSTHTHMRRMK